ncbi:MAG: HAD-IIB family hydrolase [Minisyncoccia bacterium]
MDFRNKKVIVFDLDGTLAESKQGLDQEMIDLLNELLGIKKVAIITGGGFPQLQKQVISHLTSDIEKLKNLYIFPTKGAMMYSFDGKDWNKIYEHQLAEQDKGKILDAFNQMYKEVDFLPKETFGQTLEDRGTQFTFSALGQEAPVELKKVWDIDVSKRKEIKKVLDKYLPDFSVEIGGMTSVDVTEKMIDKGFALEKICEYLNIKIDEVLFIGDAIFEGGNDYSVIKTRVPNINVYNVDETKNIIKEIML